MAYSLRHKIPDVAIDDLVRVIDIHLPNPIHKSKYMFFKSFPDTDMITYYFCKPCQHIVVVNGDCGYCGECKSQYRIQDLRDKKMYFVKMSLKEQLREMVQSEIFLRMRKDCPESDIVNSGVYRQKRADGIIGENDLTVSWNIDGIEFQRNSPQKPWTILVSVNELGYRDRKKNIILCEFWNGDHQPSMELFMKPFMDELRDLSTNGFMSSTYTDKEEKLIKVHPICAPVDSMARFKCQNMTSCRGRCGCPICFHPGQMVPVGRGSARVYPFGEHELRTHLIHQRIWEIMARSDIKSMLGLKGPPMTSHVPGTDPIWHFPPEYLHMGPLGSIKAFAESWFDTANHDKPFYLGHRLEEINQRLLAMKPPTELTRAPKKFGGKYNANDWKNFALYYSIPCLTGIMKPKYLKHWLLLVYGYHMFLQDQLNDEDCIRGQAAFDKFVEDTPKLYGIEHVRFNLHLHTHVLQFVRAYGAMWAWSAFSFEGYNGILKTLTHGTQCIAEQACNATLRIRYLRNNSHVFSSDDCDEKTVKLFIRLMDQCKVKNCIEYKEKLRAFGKPQTMQLSLVEKVEIEEKLGMEVEFECESFLRFIYDHMLIHSSLYKRLKKRENCFIMTNDIDVYKVEKLVRVRRTHDRKVKYIILAIEMEILDEQLCSNGNFSSDKFSMIVRQTKNVRAVKPKSIRSKCVRILFDNGKSCIIPLVNRQETD